MRLAGLAGALVAATWGCGAREPAANPPTVAQTAGPAGFGSVEGIVTIRGPVPRLEPRVVSQDHAACGRAAKPSVALVIGEANALGGAVVRLVGAPAPEARTAYRLDQKGCDYEPHVQVVPAGASVAFVNGDAVHHNIHAYDAENRTLFNVAQPLQGDRLEKVLTAAGRVRVKCDVHPWMSAFIWVADVPAAVTGRDGRFALGGVPAGSYKLAVWHELLGEKEEPVTVAPGRTARVAVSLSLLDPAP